MDDSEYDSEGLRAQSKKTANARVARYARGAKVIAEHTRAHGMLRKEELLEQLGKLGKPSGHKIPQKLIPKLPE